jgi:hypothetical protein
MSIKDSVKKDFGDEIILSASSVVDKESIVIPVSPALDMILEEEYQREVLWF